MSDNNIQPVYCIYCRQPMAESDTVCKSCGETQGNVVPLPTTPQGPPPLSAPQITPNFTKPQSTGIVLLKVFLTGMGIVGCLWIGFITVIILGGILVLLIILSGGKA
jgi:hypothetical protein